MAGSDLKATFTAFDEESGGTYEVCPVCYWEDDSVQSEEPNYDGGANGRSLNEAKENFAKFGAIKQDYTKDVRKPLEDELPSDKPASTGFIFNQLPKMV